MDIHEILRRYTAGEETPEDVNAALEAAGAGFRLTPGRNELTDQDRRETVAGYYPEQAAGFGLLDTGTGSMEKVRVTGGTLEFPVNEVLPDGSTNMRAFVLIAGRRYEVMGRRLAEVRPDKSPAPVERVPKRPDLRRRTDLAGQVVRQHTRTGDFDVHYDDLGYAVKSTRAGWRPPESADGDE